MFYITNYQTLIKNAPFQHHVSNHLTNSSNTTFPITMFPTNHQHQQHFSNTTSPTKQPPAPTPRLQPPNQQLQQHISNYPTNRQHPLLLNRERRAFLTNNIESITYMLEGWWFSPPLNVLYYLLSDTYQKRPVSNNTSPTKQPPAPTPHFQSTNQPPTPTTHFQQHISN